MKELKSVYLEVKKTIEERIAGFLSLREASDYRLFKELVFCLLTPQSKAVICWEKTELLFELGIEHLDEEQIAEVIRGVRFRKTKARYVALARDLFVSERLSLSRLLSSMDSFSARKWLVKNIKGMGFKEASHFLRNTGFGLELAILDRHILKNLKLFGVIDEIPKSLREKKYMEIEGKMQKFSKRIGIPMAHLDLLFWFKETGFVFK